MKKLLSLTGCVAALGFMMLAGGCQWQPQVYTTQPEPIHHAMSPEMQTLGYTSAERWTRIARSKQTTDRHIGDDWDRFWLLDNPSRLTDYPN